MEPESLARQLRAEGFLPRNVLTKDDDTLGIERTLVAIIPHLRELLSGEAIQLRIVGVQDLLPPNTTHAGELTHIVYARYAPDHEASSSVRIIPVPYRFKDDKTEELHHYPL